MKIIDGIPVWGDPINNAVEQMQRAVSHTGASQAALMADHHLGYGVPVGGVIAYKDHISPSGVGFDIACGNMAVQVDVESSWLSSNISRVMDELWRKLEFGIGRGNKEAPDHELFDDDPAWGIPAVGKLKQLARDQIGTIGAGNHYVDLFISESGAVWIGVHFGSRGFGHKIAKHYIGEAGGRDGFNALPCLLEAESEIGQEYIAAMHLAGRYAYAGREWVCERVAGLLSGQIVQEVHNHHNFAWREVHGDEELWVVRKGATPAWPGQCGFVGATMAEPSVILRGVEHADSALALYSTVHGAGRAMSRTMAAGKLRRRTMWCCQNYRRCDYKAAKGGYFKAEGGPTPKCPECGHKLRLGQVREIKKPGLISTAERMGAVASAGVELRGGGNDEAPRAYKRLCDVLWAHRGTVDILQRLYPIGVAMAGGNEFDPYKD